MSAQLRASRQACSTCSRRSCIAPRTAKMAVLNKATTTNAAVIRLARLSRPPPRSALCAARSNWRFFGGAAEYVDGQDEPVGLTRAQVVEGNAVATVQMPGDHAWDLELEVAPRQRDGHAHA